MAIVYPTNKTSSQRAYATVSLSTAADGITGSDVVDCGGLTLSGLALTTLVSTACTYTFRGGVSVGSSTGATDGYSDLLPVYSSSGALISYGSTAVNPVGSVLAFDPAPFMGLRYIQLVSNTTAAAAPNKTGAVARVLLAAIGQQR